MPVIKTPLPLLDLLISVLHPVVVLVLVITVDLVIKQLQVEAESPVVLKPYPLVLLLPLVNI